MCIVMFCLQHYIFVKVSNDILTIITYQFVSYDTIRRGDIFFKIAPTSFDFFVPKFFMLKKWVPPARHQPVRHHSHPSLIFPSHATIFTASACRPDGATPLGGHSHTGVPCYALHPCLSPNQS